MFPDLTLLYFYLRGYLNEEVDNAEAQTVTCTAVTVADIMNVPGQLVSVRGSLQRCCEVWV
jgi:hypothetical protein